MRLLSAATATVAALAWASLASLAGAAATAAAAAAAAVERRRNPLMEPDVPPDGVAYRCRGATIWTNYWSYRPFEKSPYVGIANHCKYRGGKCCALYPDGWFGMEPNTGYKCPYCWTDIQLISTDEIP